MGVIGIVLNAMSGLWELWEFLQISFQVCGVIRISLNAVSGLWRLWEFPEKPAVVYGVMEIFLNAICLVYGSYGNFFKYRFRSMGL